ncbi:MAG: methyl-accepting chemotaxis protein [Marinospirillum sp.]|nr:methyl-accepting chemotaxis protein [Marinospirillum sp.]MDR9467220.1 methyl-accepting chemotaxis protein [Marinospirillum sp.]
MFNSSLKKQVLSLRQQLQENNSNYQAQVEQLQQELQQARDENQALQEALAAQKECDVTATSLKGASMLEAIREGLADKAEALIAERKALKQLDDVFAQTRTAVEKLDYRAANIKSQAQESASEASELAQKAEGIGKLISSIQEISDQTNLLSLNAAIEAARAGEQGRGFAVVADEVRQLAGKAREASEQIDTMVSQIIDQTHTIKSRIDTSVEGAEEVSASSVQIDAMVDEVIQRSERMQKIIYETTTNAFLNTVKLDHAVWKNNVYRKVQQQDFAEPLGGHTQCRLGKWYFEGYGSRHYKGLKSFQDLDIPHKAVHDYGNQALDAGSRGDQEAMVAALEAMEDASHQVVYLIDRLQEEITG